jgi:hypothetical protein
MADAILSATEKPRQIRSNIKSMLIIFMDIRGIVHKEFVSPGQTFNGKFYCEVLRRLRKNVRRKRPKMWKNGNWLLHPDNAPAHTSFVVREFLIKNNVTTVPHPAYSADLALCDFYVFPKMKFRLKGRRFASIEEVQAESQQILNTLTPAELSEFFEKWQNRWDRFVQAQGDYFEGDGGANSRKHWVATRMYMYLCMYAFMCVYICICAYVCVYMYVCMYICNCVYICICVYAYIYVCVYICKQKG